MSKTRRRVAAGILLAALGAACSWPALAIDWNLGFWKLASGSGSVKSESRAVSGVTGVSLSLPGSLEIRQGEVEGLTIECDDNLLPMIEAVVESGTLKLRSKPRNTTLKITTLKFVLSVKAMDSIEVAGSGDIRAAALKAAALRVRIAGSGDVSIAALDAGSLDLSIAGSGDFQAGGRAASVHASIAGSGDIAAEKLDARTVELSIAGSGDAKVWARDTLSVKVAGSGDVLYYGDPKLATSIAGSGSVKRLGASPL